MSNDCNVEYNLLVNIILCMQKNHIFKDRLTAKGKKGRQGGKEEREKRRRKEDKERKKGKERNHFLFQVVFHQTEC